MTACIKSFEYGKHLVTLETGAVARQADGAVMVTMGGTVVLVTAVGIKEASDRDFFPLTVNYQERMYAVGKIPGGFFKREGRPSEHETLTARLIDRPIRPMFPSGFMHEVQIIATVMSINPDVSPDIPALIGASAALAVSGIPFNGPLAAARVGIVDGEMVLNPSITELKDSALDLVVAGTSTSVLMVESEAKQLPESTMLDAVMYGHEQMQIVIKAINELASESCRPKWDWAPKAIDESLLNQVKESTFDELSGAYLTQEKEERYTKLKAIRKGAVEALAKDDGPSNKDVLAMVSKLESQIVRQRVLNGERRIDGRDTETVRPIQVKTGVLPRSHGSAFFTRGETQAIVVSTIATGRDAQIIDIPSGEYKEHFLLHYNFPPYCVGEAGMVGSPKRREIGHGRLAKRAIQGVLPSQEEFPYVIRIVSEITESNGSSSMASVCGASLALMDSGVPIDGAVAGIAMGLVKEDDKFAVLSDILGDEDHLGDMDFKVAGTQKGVTALQMDIKIDGITKDIMQVALEQAKKGRVHILGIMNEAMNEPRVEISDLAPRIVSFSINPEKIRDVIGKGGATIRGLSEEFDASIEIDDNGRVSLVTKDRDASDLVKARIEELTADVEVGKIYDGKVVRVMDFGAFVTILPGRDGLVHISQISEQRIENINGVIDVGQEVKVKVLEVDRQGRIRLSMKAVEAENAAAATEAAAESKDEASPAAVVEPSSESPVEAGSDSN